MGVGVYYDLPNNHAANLIILPNNRAANLITFGKNSPIHPY